MAIIIDNKSQEYHVFVAEMLEEFKKLNITGIAVIGLTDSDTIAGYWNMNVEDKVKAESHIRFDTIDAFIIANKERYAINNEYEED